MIVFCLKSLKIFICPWQLLKCIHSNVKKSLHTNWENLTFFISPVGLGTLLPVSGCPPSDREPASLPQALEYFSTSQRWKTCKFRRIWKKRKSWLPEAWNVAVVLPLELETHCLTVHGISTVGSHSWKCAVFIQMVLALKRKKMEQITLLLF